MQEIYCISRNKNWGTRFPAEFCNAFFSASNKQQALVRFNKHLKLGNEICQKVSKSPLPTKVSELDGEYSVKKIEVFI